MPEDDSGYRQNEATEWHKSMNAHCHEDQNVTQSRPLAIIIIPHDLYVSQGAISLTFFPQLKQHCTSVKFFASLTVHRRCYHRCQMQNVSHKRIFFKNSPILHLLQP